MHSAGIDFGGTSTKLALIEDDGRVLAFRRVAGRPSGSLEVVFGVLAAALARMAAEARRDLPPPGGVGIGVAGIVDPDAGRVEVAGALDLLGDVRAVAERAFGGPVAIESDSNAGALADLHFGVARGTDDLLYLSWGTGIGAGLVVGGRLVRSRGHAIGEIGHTVVAPDSARVCYCGCRGCLEVEAGGRAIAAAGSAALGREATVLQVAQAARDGHGPCAGLLAAAAGQVARGIAPALVLLNPQAVVLGGGVSRILELPAVRAAFDRELERHVPAFARRGLAVSLSAFGDMAGAVGAALLPRHGEEERGHGRPGA